MAIDPGRVQGSLKVNDRAVALTQAYAHLHDNAERLLDRPQELRLLLADREVPPEAQAGPEAESWAKQAAAELRDSTRRLKRVVVRGDHAVAVFAGKRGQNFVRQGGEWKSDN